MNENVLVSIFLGSTSDLPQMSKGLKLLDRWKIPYRLHILSAHRTPVEMERKLKEDERAGTRVVIGAAGMAAHLPGVLASKTILPVIGVPLASGPLNGVDALYSIVQMPPGIPVATMAIGSAGAQNAVIFAAKILGGKWLEMVEIHKNESAEKVLENNRLVNEKGYQDFIMNNL